MTPVSGFDISRDTFSQLDVDAKLDILFDMVKSFHEGYSRECLLRHQTCADRFAKVETAADHIAQRVSRSLKINRAIITLAALLGGMAGSLMSYLR